MEEYKTDEQPKINQNSSQINDTKQRKILNKHLNIGEQSKTEVEVQRDGRSKARNK